MSFVGGDGPRRFAVTRAEALQALDDFVDHLLPAFGPHEDAVLDGDPWMAHSLLSARGACRRCWQACASTAGHTTSPG